MRRHDWYRGECIDCRVPFTLEDDDRECPGREPFKIDTHDPAAHARLVNRRRACERALDAVKTMRRCQREYFASRSRESLEASKKYEREVDKLLAELDAPEPAQGGLFK